MYPYAATFSRLPGITHFARNGPSLKSFINQLLNSIYRMATLPKGYTPVLKRYPGVRSSSIARTMLFRRFSFDAFYEIIIRSFVYFVRIF